MKTTHCLIALGLLGLTLLPAHAQEGREQGRTDQPARAGTRDKEYYKEQLQLLKDTLAFLNDPANMPVMTPEDVQATVALNMDYLASRNGGAAGQRRQRPTVGTTKVPRPVKELTTNEYAGRMIAIAVEIYSHKNPADYSKVKELLQAGVPLNPSAERTMHQMPAKYTENLKPFFTPPGTGGVNPRARQAGGGRRPQVPQPLPRTTWEPTWKLLGQALTTVHDSLTQPHPK